MTHSEKQLDSVSRYIAITGKRCYFCAESRDLHNHHIFFGQHKSVWYFRWSPQFQIPLCKNHHQHDPTAPHVDINAFWKKLEAVMSRTEPLRWALINYYRNSKADIPEKPDMKEFLRDLKAQAAKIEKEQWIDLDSYQETYKGRIDGEPIYG